MATSALAQTAFQYVMTVLLGDDYEQHVPPNAIQYSDQGIESGAPDPLTRVQIVPSSFFGDKYGTKASLPKFPLYELDDVPLLFGRPQVENHPNLVVVHADIIASTFFLVTRYEERVRKETRDRHGRFPGRDSLPVRGRFIARPVVEEYAFLLRRWLRKAGVDIPEPQREFSVLLTHDVDAPFSYNGLMRTLAGVLSGKRELSDFIDNFQIALGLKKDPLYNFDEIIRLDNQLLHHPKINAQSAYFFMGGGGSQYDNGYDVGDHRILSLVQSLTRYGCTVGMHTSYQAGLEPSLIIREKEKIEKHFRRPILHNRHHYLAWREIEDGWEMVRSGLTWDSTLGYADIAGFRLGVCHPIPLFDPIKMELMGIEEHPLIIMDCSLSDENYMNLDDGQAFTYCRRLIHNVRRFNGELVLLWHNTQLVPLPGNYHPKLYRKILAEIMSFYDEDEKGVEL